MILAPGAFPGAHPDRRTVAFSNAALQLRKFSARAITSSREPGPPALLNCAKDSVRHHELKRVMKPRVIVLDLETVPDLARFGAANQKSARSLRGRATSTRAS